MGDFKMKKEEIFKRVVEETELSYKEKEYEVIYEREPNLGTLLFSIMGSILLIYMFIGSTPSFEFMTSHADLDVLKVFSVIGYSVLVLITLALSTYTILLLNEFLLYKTYGKLKQKRKHLYGTLKQIREVEYPEERKPKPKKLKYKTIFKNGQ
jgi:hypothetical protein